MALILARNQQHEGIVPRGGEGGAGDGAPRGLILHAQDVLDGPVLAAAGVRRARMVRDRSTKAHAAAVDPSSQPST